jgi:hypothetical protein
MHKENKKNKSGVYARGNKQKEKATSSKRRC